MAKLRVGVVFGGRSVEHDVSIVTAHQAMAALSTRHEVVPIYVDREGRWWTDPALNDIAVFRDQRWAEVGESAVLPATAGGGGLLIAKKMRSRTVALDVVVPSIHGTSGEDGTLHRALELAGLAYAGSGRASPEASIDECALKAAFKAARHLVVPDVLVEAERLDAVAEAWFAR